MQYFKLFHETKKDCERQLIDNCGILFKMILYRANI